MKSGCKTLPKQSMREKGKNKKLSEMIGLLQEEIDRQRRQGESRTREYQAAQEKNRQLQEQVRQVEEKSKLYDEAAASIGSAILQAQQTAQSIVDEAGGQAKEIVDRGQHAGGRPSPTTRSASSTGCCKRWTICSRSF